MSRLGGRGAYIRATARAANSDPTDVTFELSCLARATGAAEAAAAVPTSLPRGLL